MCIRDRAGVVHHQTRIAQILAHPESYELYCNILLAAEGLALLGNQARELFQIYQHLQPVE